jgi:Domain of unknown function (DUF4494)
MKNHFQVRVKVTRNVKGKVKRVFENYLVEAQTFTETEANITEFFVNPERPNFEENKTMSISDIDRFQIDNIFGFDFSEKYWLVKLDYNNLEDKPVKLKYLVNAVSPEQASNRLLEIITSDSDKNRYEVNSISFSAILEVVSLTVNEDSK